MLDTERMTEKLRDYANDRYELEDHTLYVIGEELVDEETPDWFLRELAERALNQLKKNRDKELA